MVKMGRKSLFRNALFAAAGMAAVMLAPAAQAAGTLTITLVQDPGSWDPLDTFLVNWAKVATNLFDGLVQRGPDMKLVPGLAASWEELDEGKRIRFKLRENVKFHNGEGFDAAAVKFTFDRLLGAEGAKGPQQSNYNVIEQAVVVDPMTVDLVLKQPDPVLLTKLAGYGAMIVPPKYIQEKGEEYFNTHPVGTGPFKFADYQPKVSVTLENFAEHWGTKPKLDKLVYRFIAEPATQVAELQAGRVDIVTDPLPISAIPIVSGDAKLKVEAVTGPTVQSLRFNTKTGITADERVRKAIIMAVDREAIIKQILSGQGKMIASFQSELSFGYDPALKPLPFDPAGAKKLLAEAGVKPGSTVQIDFRGSDANFREVAQAVAGFLQGVGLRANLKPYDTNVILNEIIPTGKTGEMFQQAWGGWTFDYDNTAYLMYHTGEKWNPYDSNAELDKLLESQRGMTDRAKREKVLQDIGKYVADKALELPLFNLYTLYGVNKRVKNFTTPPDNRLRLTEVTVD